ncbi:putative integral membrane protein [Babesia bovis T2Bo]|uniref:Uncharacterized protein n=1 Tax=Babesia bovis TaxID=5865 RepID=A7ASW8_BABBO|nr:putative integral membrane protein [Babesia bovis T2Bo]EDO06029.1 putative integral membrane protein [Babesia bovis T2Bo]|eukprot:XP_001609597.1 hypothetical protein [Babesia bovis T2Bo]
MAVTARNNGFRKVAKWIVGAVVVASASHGIVMAQEETPKIAEVPEQKETKTEVTEVPEEKDSNAAKGKQKKRHEPIFAGEVQLQRIKDEMEREEPVYDPDDVAVVTSTGITYKNQDIDDLIDKKVYISALTRWFHPKSVPHIEKCELNRRRKEMRLAIRELDELLNQLPEEVAKVAKDYPTIYHMPSKLAAQIQKYLEKKD